MNLRELSFRISSATVPGNVLDIEIFRYLFNAPTWHGETPRYTTDVTIALTLAAQHVPSLALIFLKHPNGMWSMAASDDGVPQFDGSMFEEQYLALSIVATVFETLVDRAARQQ